MTISDDMLFRWLDGELGQDEADAVEAAVAADPSLEAKAEQHRQMQQQLRSAFDSVKDQPIDPARFGLAKGGTVVSLAEARAERERRRPSFWQQAAAAAAVFVMGLATGNMLLGGTSGPIAPEAGRLVAAASLEQALYSRLASAPADDGPRIGLTYRDQGGQICRTFVDGAASGLACFEEGDWRIRGLFQSAEGQSGPFRMAAGQSPELAGLVESTIAGEPFDAAQERAAKARGWR